MPEFVIPTKTTTYFSVAPKQALHCLKGEKIIYLTELSGVAVATDTLAVGAGSSVEAGTVAVSAVVRVAGAGRRHSPILADAEIRLDTLAWVINSA